MGLLNYLFPKSSAENESNVESSEVEITAQSSNLNTHRSYTNLQPIITTTFDGEKTPGELGSVNVVNPDHLRLRYRAYEAELKSDVIKIIAGKFFNWVVGSGLKIQAEPEEVVLKSEGITNDFTNFRNVVEHRFRLFCDSKRAHYSELDSPHKLAKEAFRNAFLGGDCLIILRVENGDVNIQLIDGENVCTPWLDDKLMKAVESRGNIVKNGIEKDNRGRHVAYFVRVVDKENVLGKYQRVEAKGKRTGRTMARLITGVKHRIDSDRGIPAITAILEKAGKLDRYTEATVAGAEERAKIAFSIEHTKDSTGENPMANQMRVAMGAGGGEAIETEGYELGEKTATRVAATTGKQVFNMPVGSVLKSLDSDAEVQYEPFFKAVFYSLCAAMDMPPEVALQAYNSNYSASRAAINGWEYLVKIYRKEFADNFYQPIYNLWLELEILKNKVSAPQYIKLLREQNHVAVQAYSKARFTGVNMPHIDPVKETKAITEQINAKLISREQGTEQLNQGDWSENYKKLQGEDKTIGDVTDKTKNREQNSNLESNS